MITELARLDLPDGHLAYSDRGSGPAVLLLHGGTLDHRLWRRQMEPLLRSHRVIAADLRGHGWSATPVPGFRHCDDIAALIRELGIAPAHLVGISLGASTAVDLAVEYPELVASVTISGAGTNDPDFRDPWQLGVLERWHRAAENRDQAAWLREFLRLGFGPYRDPSEVDPHIVAEVDDMARHTIDHHLPGGAPVLPTPVADIRRRATTITAPVCAVLGMLDSADHIRMPRELAEAVGHGRVVEIDGAAHYPNLERPEAFTAAVLAFLDSQRT